MIDLDRLSNAELEALPALDLETDQAIVDELRARDEAFGHLARLNPPARSKGWR